MIHIGLHQSIYGGIRGTGVSRSRWEAYLLSLLCIQPQQLLYRFAFTTCDSFSSIIECLGEQIIDSFLVGRRSEMREAVHQGNDSSICPLTFCAHTFPSHGLVSIHAPIWVPGTSQSQTLYIHSCGLDLTPRQNERTVFKHLSTYQANSME